MRSNLLPVAMAVSLAASMAHAQPQPPRTVVTVVVGPALAKKTADFGQPDVDFLSDDLRRTVQSAVAKAGPNAPTRIDLILEDATPNRPTSAQLGRNVGLSLNSIGLGGARIAGVVTYADGTQRPLRDQFYQTDLREDVAADTWYDADRAIDQVASDVRRNRYPGRFRGPGTAGNGHFSYSLTDPVR